MATRLRSGVEQLEAILIIERKTQLMTWKQLVQIASDPTTQVYHDFRLSLDIENTATSNTSASQPSVSDRECVQPTLPLDYHQRVVLRRFYFRQVRFGRNQDEAVDSYIRSEIKDLLGANPVCAFDGRPFFGRHCADPRDTVSPSWSNELVYDETLTEDARRRSLRGALRSIPWAKGQTNTDLLPPVFFSVDGYDYAIAPPTWAKGFQAALLAVGPLLDEEDPSVFLFGIGPGLPHMAVRMPIAPRPAE